jgi:hypothetical protein
MICTAGNYRDNLSQWERPHRRASETSMGRLFWTNGASNSLLSASYL